MRLLLCSLLLLCFGLVEAQTDDASIFRTIVLRYYKTEKPVYKNRSQLLYLYCTRANNNAELVEAVQPENLPQEFKREIKTKINDQREQDWSSEIAALDVNDASKITQKIHACVSLETYHEVSKRLNLNNQRLMIISKPLYYSKGNLALVKVTFYRNIEHNSGSVLLLEKNASGWRIKDYLNSWQT